MACRLKCWSPKEFREKKQTPTRMEIRRRCREVAVEWVGKQSEQFQRLGIRATGPSLSDHVSGNGGERAGRVRGHGGPRLYLPRRKPVFWSFADRTALAEAEIEYEDRTDPSIYVRFRSCAMTPGCSGAQTQTAATRSFGQRPPGQFRPMSLWLSAQKSSMPLCSTKATFTLSLRPGSAQQWLLPGLRDGPSCGH